jgi:carbonic anhydrase
MTRSGTLKVWIRIRMIAATFGCFVIAGGTARAQSGPEFSYSGDEGPGFWGELSPEWENCSMDIRQSPIDIERAVGGMTCYQCGSTWYQPAYQGGQVTYVMVKPPQ